jgi:hypothetical protein
VKLQNRAESSQHSLNEDLPSHTQNTVTALHLSSNATKTGVNVSQDTY